MMRWDLVVIGGGVVGLSIAWRSAAAGAKVVVLEGGRAGQATRAAAGMLAPLAEAHSPGPLLTLSLESLALYPSFLSDLQIASGTEIEALGPGMLRVARTAGEAEILQKSLVWQRPLGLPLEWLEGQAARDLEPALSPDAAGAVHSPRETHIPPRRLRTALQRACTRAGVAFGRNVGTPRLDLGEGRVQGVQTLGEYYACEKLLIASGAWLGESAMALALTVPVKPLRGQALLLAPPPAAAFRHTLYGVHGYLVPRPGGRVLAGATEEDAGFEAQTTRTGLAGLRAMAADLVPALGGARTTERWAGLRPVCADGLPLLGRVPGWDNAFLAGGHGRNGILLAPITAHLMTCQLWEDAAPPAAFSPARFGEQS